jgi:hypothetical protein
MSNLARVTEAQRLLHTQRILRTEEINAYRILIGNPKVCRQFEDEAITWRGDVKMNFSEIRRKIVHSGKHWICEE